MIPLCLQLNSDEATRKTSGSTARTRLKSIPTGLWKLDGCRVSIRNLPAENPARCSDFKRQVNCTDKLDQEFAAVGSGNFVIKVFRHVYRLLDTEVGSVKSVHHLSGVVDV